MENYDIKCLPIIESPTANQLDMLIQEISRSKEFSLDVKGKESPRGFLWMVHERSTRFPVGYVGNRSIGYAEYDSEDLRNAARSSLSRYQEFLDRVRSSRDFY